MALPENVSSVETTTQDSITESDNFDHKFLEAPNLAGGRPKRKVGDRVITILLTRHPDSDPKSDLPLHCHSHFTLLLIKREMQERWAQRLGQIKPQRQKPNNACKAKNQAKGKKTFKDALSVHTLLFQWTKN